MSPSFLHDIACCSYMVLSSHNYQEVFSMGVHISNAYHPTNPTLTKLNYDHLIGNTFNQMDEPCCSAISFNLISMQSYPMNWELFVLYVLVMSRTRFRVNPHSIVAWMSRNSLLEAGAKSEEIRTGGSGFGSSWELFVVSPFVSSVFLILFFYLIFWKFVAVLLLYKTW